MTAWRNSPTPRVDALLLVLIASLAMTVVRANNAWNPTSLAVRAVCELLVTIALSIALCRRAGSLAHAKGLLAIAIFAAIIYPFVAELALRQFAGGSEPLEILMLSSLQLMAVVLAVFSQLPRVASSAVLLSSFLLLFVTTMTSSRIALVLVGIYGMMVLWWLMGAYWDRLAGALVATQVERRIPVRVAVLGGTGIFALLLATLIGATRVSAVALHGFMPTSGGTRWHDPQARSGVGDGDAMVAAKYEAKSFGPVESDLFLESDMPSLYDMSNDLYGDPPKPKRELERNIALASENFTATHEPMSKTERSGREFSAVRRRGKRNSTTTLEDRLAPAMLYVVGRVPLHLALERFDTFDGRQWTHSGETEIRPPIRLEIWYERPWAYLMRAGSSSIHRGVESHAVKIINLNTNRFPSPPQLTAIHVDKVDQPDFFGWTDDGVACMPVRKQIPQLTVAHLQSQGVNLQPLRSSPTNNWRKVEAVVERLRSEFVLDPNAPAPEECTDVVAHFLSTKRGPDYLFATTAAVMLRELGYVTRLVAGFYARHDRFDHRAGQTSVLADDVHVWVEVFVNGNSWVAIEPTPGYDAPRESLTWRQWAMFVLTKCVDWCAEHIAIVLAGSVLVALLFVARCVWLDMLAGCVCCVMGLRSNRARLLWTIRLLEWRGWLAGSSRPRRSTIASWYAPLVENAPPDVQPPLAHFLRCTDRLLYSPAGIDATEHSVVDSVCRSAASTCTRKLLATSFCQSK